MPTLHLLGTGAALSSADRTTTMLAIEGDSSVVVIDCGGDVVHRLLVAGIDLDRIAVLILTHEHPDHVSGFPLFMEKIWLSKRRRPIPVCGPAAAIEQAKRVFGAFDTSGWSGMPRIEWTEVELETGARVWEDDELVVTAAPGVHSVPVIGVRVEVRATGSAIAYSSDTERAEPIVQLARDVRILVHEGTGDFKGHVSPPGAARVASDAGAAQLVLVHNPPVVDEEAMARARAIFPALEVGVDGGSYRF